MSFFGSDIFDSNMSSADANDKVFGLMIGTVTAIGQGEDLGKVKVALSNMSTSEFETDFIRVVTPMAGPNFGMAFFPEVKDEVLVGFENGSLNEAYVLGCLWNNNNKFPLDMGNPGDGEDPKNDIRQIVTKSGHTLIFNDTDDETAIELKTKEGLSIKIDEKNQVVTILGDKDAKNAIEINGKDGAVSIKAEKKIELISGDSKLSLDGNGKAVSIESGGKMNIKGQNVSIEGSSNAAMKGQSGLTMESSGQTVVKGSIVKIN